MVASVHIAPRIRLVGGCDPDFAPRTRRDGQDVPRLQAVASSLREPADFSSDLMSSSEVCSCDRARPAGRREGAECPPQRGLTGPRRKRRRRNRRRTRMTSETFDFIVVGGGSAGCAAAARLVTDGDYPRAAARGGTLASASVARHAARHLQDDQRQQVHALPYHGAAGTSRRPRARHPAGQCAWRRIVRQRAGLHARPAIRLRRMERAAARQQ